MTNGNSVCVLPVSGPMGITCLSHIIYSTLSFHKHLNRRAESGMLLREWSSMLLFHAHGGIVDLIIVAYINSERSEVPTRAQPRSYGFWAYPSRCY